MAGSGRRLFTKKESEAEGFLARSLGGKACDAILFPISLFAAALVRFLYCGFTYFPQLDDYIQYHNYAATENIPELLDRLGAFSVRPLALVADICVWSRFWGRMIVPLIIMAALWTASAIFLWEVLRRFYPVGNFFPLIFVLLPLNIEATYWLSASSRIVVGTFFASLSAYFLTLFCERGKKRFAALFLLFNILSFCFYEQCLIFSLVLTVLVAVRFLGKPCKRAFLGAGVLLSGGVYIAVTHLFATEGV